MDLWKHAEGCTHRLNLCGFRDGSALSPKMRKRDNGPLGERMLSVCPDGRDHATGPLLAS